MSGATITVQFINLAFLVILIKFSFRLIHHTSSSFTFAQTTAKGHIITGWISGIYLLSIISWVFPIWLIGNSFTPLVLSHIFVRKINDCEMSLWKIYILELFAVNLFMTNKQKNYGTTNDSNGTVTYPMTLQIHGTSRIIRPSFIKSFEYRATFRVNQIHGN